MRILAHIGATYLVLLVAGALWRLFPFDVVAPQIAVGVAAYLGVAARDRVPVDVFGAIAVGYLADLLGGSPRGLMALSCGVLCIVARLLSARLLVRGALVVGSLAFFASVGVGLMIVGIRALLGASVASFAREAVVVGGTALLTALVAPPVFRMCRGVDAFFARTHRERQALKEGYLT